MCVCVCVCVWRRGIKLTRGQCQCQDMHAVTPNRVCSSGSVHLKNQQSTCLSLSTVSQCCSDSAAGASSMELLFKVIDNCMDDSVMKLIMFQICDAHVKNLINILVNADVFTDEDNNSR